MGKQGPCHHCGVTSTPLWRNGPPGKPVLCNACGSRWRTKGTLAKYRPLHARTEPDEFEDYRVQRVRTIPIKNKEARVLKRKKNHDIEVAETVDPDHCFKNDNGDTSDYNHVYWKDFDEDPSNKSSSGSAISNSESCVQLGSAGASYLTGPSQSIVWDSTVPSRKRTCVGRPKTSSVEKLTKVLRTILHEQQFYLSGPSEEALLFESDTPMVSFEIGHGSVLIRHPSSIARKEESEVSSLSVDKKHNSANEAYSPLTTLPVHDFNKPINVSCLGNERINEPVQKMEQDQYGRERTQQEKLHILGNRNSQICSTDLKVIVNFEVFGRHLTNDEQQQLMKYLPSVDTVELPDSLLSMLDSPQFNEDLCTFQKLLAEGVFDLSSSGDKSECNRTLKRLTVSNLKTSCWVEQYNMQKDINCKSTTGGALDAGEQDAVSSALSVKRSDDGKYKNLPDHICLKGQTLQGINSRSFSVAKRARAKSTINITKRKVMTNNYGQKELEGNHANCFSPTSLFGLPPDSTSLMLDSFQCAAESFDQDLLLNVPFHTSFPQAELLPTSSFGAQVSTDSSSIHENA